MKQKVTVIGSGISGITSAFLLSQKYYVTLVEANDTLGGHTHTVSVQDELGNAQNIDMGFIVFNLNNYPLFTKFLNKLNVPYQDSDMSFGYYDVDEAFWYASDIPSGIFSQKKRIFSPRYLRFLRSIPKFNERVLFDLKNNLIQDESLDMYLGSLPFSEFFYNHYVLPMGAAIWSCPIEDILKFPAKSFFEFWRNHSLLTVGNRPTWKTVKGGSNSYIRAFLKQFPGTIKKSSPVRSIYRDTTSVTVRLDNNEVIESHYVVIANHADQALRLLESPTQLESELLGVWQYSRNTVVLHTDSKVMPPKKSAWSSWLVQKPQHHNVLHMTYYMNRLQKLNTTTDFFVTLNEQHTIDEDKIKVSKLFTHPIYDTSSVETQPHLHQLNTGLTRFCGSYFGYGFHEDGVRSAVEACKTLGVDL